MPQAARAVEALFGVQVEEATQKIELRRARALAVAPLERVGLGDREGDVAVRGVHFEEHAVLHDEGPEELLDAVQLVDVRLAGEEGLAVEQLGL